MRLSRWGRRLGKKSSSRDTQESRDWTPSPPSERPIGTSSSSMTPLQSPYHSEEAHVQSLQRPSGWNDGSANRGNSPSTTVMKRTYKIPAATPSPNGETASLAHGIARRGSYLRHHRNLNSTPPTPAVSVSPLTDPRQNHLQAMQKSTVNSVDSAQYNPSEFPVVSFRNRQSPEY